RGQSRKEGVFVKLTHPLFSAPVRFREDRVQVLVIEALEAFRKLVAELTAQSEGGEGTFVLSSNDACLVMEDHIRVICDFIYPQALEKKVQSKAIAALPRKPAKSFPRKRSSLRRRCRHISANWRHWRITPSPLHRAKTF